MFLTGPFLRNAGKRRAVSYPYSKLGVFFSFLLLILSLIFALAVLFDKFFSLVLYFVLTSFLTVIFFFLKRYIWHKRDESASIQLNERRGSQKWRIITLYLGIPAILIIPLILGLFLDPTGWFVSISSFVSGISLSECILFYTLKYKKTS